MIKKVFGREIIDSRGNPTIEASVITDKGEFVSSVPSGASTGASEMVELRDGGERFMGKGVLSAVENVNNKIGPALINQRTDDPFFIDKKIRELDGTKDKSNLGSNAILSVSMSVFRAAAAEKNLTLYDYLSKNFSFEKRIPRPCFNIVNGGAHSGGGVSFQEFMIVPQKEKFSKNLQEGVEFYHKLKKIITEKYGKSSTNIGDEGGFVPNAKDAKEVLTLLHDINKNLPIIIDVAASEFYSGEKYTVDGVKKDRDEIILMYQEIVDSFSVIGIEDPLYEEDFEGWSELSLRLKDILIVGDDLLTTNIERMKRAKKESSCNAMILKINQIGSISEAILAAKEAKEYGWKIIVSHRSGETCDDFIADFAVGIGSEYIKSGAPVRGERIAKYNRLLKIEDEIINKNNN